MIEDRMMNFVYLFIAALLLIFFLLKGYGFINSQLDDSTPITTQDVYQYVDHDGRVVCYILENGNGISCLPMSEVNLNE